LCQVRTVWRMRNSNERIFFKTVLIHSKNESSSCAGGHSAKVHGFPSIRKEFHNQRIHNVSKELLCIEIPPDGIISTT
jgi:hypothetical protein